MCRYKVSKGQHQYFKLFITIGYVIVFYFSTLYVEKMEILFSCFFFFSDQNLEVNFDSLKF